MESATQPCVGLLAGAVEKLNLSTPALLMIQACWRVQHETLRVAHVTSCGRDEAMPGLRSAIGSAGSVARGLGSKACPWRVLRKPFKS